MLFCHALILTLFRIVVTFVFACRYHVHSLDLMSSHYFQNNLSQNWTLRVWSQSVFVHRLLWYSRPEYTLVLCSLHLNLCNLPSFFSRVAAHRRCNRWSQAGREILVLHVKLEPPNDVMIFPLLVFATCVDYLKLLSVFFLSFLFFGRCLFVFMAQTCVWAVVSCAPSIFVR